MVQNIPQAMIFQKSLSSGRFPEGSGRFSGSGSGRVVIGRAGGRVFFQTSYIYIYIPQTKTARQGRGSYFRGIVIPLNSRILVAGAAVAVVAALGT